MAGAARQRGNAARSAPREVFARVQRAWGESPFYQARLKGPAPDRLLHRPPDPYTPDKELAGSFARGRFAAGEDIVDCEGELERVWDLVAAPGPLHAFLHEFSWMRHLEALGADGAATARILVKAWLDRYEKWAADAWDPYLAAERLTQLCAHSPLVLAKTDALWRSRLLSSMARQTRHLANTAHRAETGFERLMTALGLCVAGYCLPGCEGPAERGVEMARRELRLQLRADGGHVSRNPSRQLNLCVRLQALLHVLDGRGFQAPGFLRHTMTRAAAMAVLFRCADGRLAVFNGGYEDDARALLAIQSAVDPESAPTGFARHSGYHKLASGRALIIADTGDDAAPRRIKSAGSFHFSSGRARVIVNCGNGGRRAKAWRRALEQRDAHSALSFEGAGRSAPSFAAISHRRAEDGKGQLLEFEREIAAAQGEGGAYIRRLFLAAGGGDLRGEELLTGLPEEIAAAAVWRFHLHPSVRASLARDQRSVILLLPNKEGWRFKSNCAALRLEKSVYCGEGGAPVATEQIVMRAADRDDRGSGAAAKWALRRLDAV